MSRVELVNVGKAYRSTQVLMGVSLEIRDGEFLVLLGPSGCGKTTCLRIIAGLETNTSGRVIVGDEVVSDPEKKIFIPPEKRKIGMVFQSYALWPHMTVSENVAYPLRIAKAPKQEVKERVARVLELVELSTYGDRKPHQLSGGQQQRVALARGLVMEPRVLLMDEPLSNLDAKLREKMRVDLRALQQKLKLTVVHVTHDQLEATTMSDRMVVMKDGHVLQVGTPEEIRRKPANDFVADFIRSH